MKFAMFFMAEYANFFVWRPFCSLRGGSNHPTFGLRSILQPGVVAVCSGSGSGSSFSFFYTLDLGTLPRFHYDQLMAFSWKLSVAIVEIANILVTASRS